MTGLYLEAGLVQYTDLKGWKCAARLSQVHAQLLSSSSEVYCELQYLAFVGVADRGLADGVSFIIKE
jgi:hypothetical protein